MEVLSSIAHIIGNGHRCLGLVVDAQRPTDRVIRNDGAPNSFAQIDLRFVLLKLATADHQRPAGGLVVLSGTVSSWAAHDEAVAAVWSAPGVTQVENRIRVMSQP